MPHQAADLFELSRLGPDAPWIEFVERLLVCARRARERLSVEASRQGLSEPQIEMLWACAKAPPGGRCQKDLAEDLAVSPAHVSGVVERLHAAGLLQYSVAEGDRRLRYWRLTPAGQVLWQTVADDSAKKGDAA
jgi:DNA-binding MarR family transcriptional regulator